MRRNHDGIFGLAASGDGTAVLVVAWVCSSLEWAVRAADCNVAEVPVLEEVTAFTIAVDRVGDGDLCGRPAGIRPKRWLEDLLDLMLKQ